MASIISAGTTSGTALNMSGDTSGALQLATNGTTTAITIDTSQNVGIGTTSPDSSNKLQVTGDIGLTWATDKFIGMKFGAGTSYKMGLVLKDSTRECKVWSQSSDSDDKITFYTGSTPSERMRIDTSGQLILKRTAVVNAATLTCSAGQNSRAVSFVNNNNNNEVGYIFLNNDGTTTQYASSSDYRLKENIVPMTGALSVVAQLKPVKYKWKINGADGQGFIAHELQAVIPDCVTGEKDGVETYTDENGNEQTRPKHQGVDTSFLVATLTAAIQELKTINDTQAATITALTARIVALETV